jgi:multidrug efflux system membrane fusion protein
VTLNNQIDNTTGTSQLKAVFDNKDNALFPQQFVNIRLLVDTLTDQLVVPNVAIQNGQQGTFVYVVDDNSRVHLKTVQVGITTDTLADVLSGLSEGDRVVVDGTDRLSEGAEVRVRRAGEDNSGGAGNGRGGHRGLKGGETGPAPSDGNFKKAGQADNPGGADAADSGNGLGEHGGRGGHGGHGDHGGPNGGDHKFKNGDGSFRKGQHGGDTSQ